MDWKNLAAGLLGGFIVAAVHRTLTARKLSALEAKIDRALHFQAGTVKNWIETAEPLIDAKVEHAVAKQVAQTTAAP